MSNNTSKTANKAITKLLVIATVALACKVVSGVFNGLKNHQ